MLVCLFSSTGHEVGSVLIAQERIQRIDAIDKERMQTIDWKQLRLEGIPSQETQTTETGSSLFNITIPPGEERYSRALIRWVELIGFPVVVFSDERVGIWKKMERSLDTKEKALGYAMTLASWPDADLPFWKQMLSP